MEIQQDKDIVAVISMSAGFGKHANLVWAYVELFGVTPMRGKTKKIRVLLEEMKGLFDSQVFRYQKRKYGITQAGIAEALNIVVHRHFETHLDSHNYLKKIMIGISEREGRESGKQAEKDLRKKENGLRTADPSLESEENLSPEQIADNMRRLKAVVGSGIVKGMAD